MWEAHALIAHKAAEERHRNEAEEDDEEDCSTDDSLRLWAAGRRDQEEEQNKDKKHNKHMLFQKQPHFNKHTITLKSLDSEKMTHTSFLDVLFRSIPYNLAEMKWSLKAGISLSVAKQPSTDMSQLMTSGRTGMGDMFSGVSVRVYS